MIKKVFVGIDVGKMSLVVAVQNVDGTRTFCNSVAGLSKLIYYLKRFEISLIVLEACHYEKLAHQLLTKSGLSVHVANPRRARDFANAFGAHGKTDPVDAFMLAKYGQAMELEPSIVPSEAIESLKALVKRRSELVDNRSREKNRAHKSPAMKESYDEYLQFLKKKISEIEHKIVDFLETDKLKEIQNRTQILESIPGVGWVTAVYLAVYLPELGRVNRRQIASLSGVAPRNNDSGKMSGRRFVGPGRKVVKHALYMCMLAAVRYNPELKCFYERLKGKGKHNLVCRVATMKKRVVLMNTLIGQNRKWEPRMTL